MSGERVPLATPPRIGALPSLPLFHNLRDRKALVVGGSEGADWKAELLAAAGSDVVRVAGQWHSDDLNGAAIAVADLPDEAEARRFAAAARAAGVPVNLIDRTELCDFQFGTILNRDPVVLAISTSGAAPMLGQSIRARLEAVLPAGLAAWARAAQEWRPRVKALLADARDRKAFWRRFTDAAWARAEEAPKEADFAAFVEGEAGNPRGSVTLVGAGPGDPELLTLKAVRALQRATTILYDDLVGPGVLELARREAKRIAVGKSGGGPSCRQSEIDALLVDLARAGETVVRLKGGDPTIFGRAAEELAACRAAGVAVAMIPGISAGQAAAASLGLSLTERQRARRVQFVTGHGADGRLPADIDWGAIADRKATTLLYMPRATLGAFVRKALAKGLDPATPAVAAASVSLPGEAHAAGTLVEIERLAAGLPLGAPVLIVIGWVARDLAAQPASLLPFPKALAS
ncbi:MAG: uroporphyrinogen-III C-methyltransferase [Alphaproteobacteria bacterium]|nr:uroporphyrinogen-III C-methyltransferase [Alphaproteobacteria bacterium]MBV9370555.1 uroporphyrinogen-III C-methyltransferase [Alphaproteobacteria bacterium]MBV9900077.1 uroporphyrinogen-III C-methyltransferase [Alphaproteobacteria bacterium]